ncbi:prostate and testis expressed protein 1 [Odocoileus virginianus]|uniref:Prostate and testis expressed protein 1 n=1 Tax=Odocoileus virginianus TaxID=9874 RepID=A0A6J0W864_ODOVR|nr:prostate and testis expressed protein 1 [Odocoileus virginianus texanus]
MDKSLLLELPVLLCCFRVLCGSFADQEQKIGELSVDKSKLPEMIQCRTCHIQFPRQKCSRGRGLCTAVNEACTTGRIYKNDGTLWLTFRGCLKNCANVNDIRWSVYLVNFRCCRSHDLCNDDI